MEETLVSVLLDKYNDTANVHIEFELFNNNERYVKTSQDRIKNYYGVSNFREVQYEHEIITISTTKKVLHEGFDTSSRSSNIVRIIPQNIDFKLRVIVSSSKFQEVAIGEKTVNASMVESQNMRIIITPTKFIVHVNPGKLESNIREIILFYKVLHDTKEIYTYQERAKMFYSVNRALGTNGNGFLPSKALYHPRDMKLGDLVGDVFLGKTTVMFKIDGLRKLLYATEKKVWLINGANANLVTRTSKITGEYLLDGELVISNGIYHYLFFDTLVINREDLRTSTYLERRARGPKNYSDASVTIKLLPNYSYATAEEFYDTIRRLETVEKPKLPYKEDGYIFVSNELKYTSGIDSCSLKERVLTERPDWIKWKPVEKLTVDLLIENNGVYNLYSKDRLVTTIDIPTNFRDITTGTIVEFMQKDGVFVPLKVRPDKLQPNTGEEVDNLVSLSRNPIRLSTLLGEELTLMNEFHLRAINSELEWRKGTLVVFGVTAGLHFNHFTKIYIVEDDKEKINDLVTQLDTIGESYSLEDSTSDSKYIVINTQEEIPEKADVVLCYETLHLVDVSKLRHIVKGVLLYLTLDGSALKNLFHPIVKNRVTPSDGEVISDNYTIKELDNGVELNTTYYPYVYPAVLVQELQAKYVFTRMGYDSMLSQQERYLSSLYSMGIISSVAPKEKVALSLQSSKGDVERSPYSSKEDTTKSNKEDVTRSPYSSKEDTVELPSQYVDLPELDDVTRLSSQYVDLPELDDVTRLPSQYVDLPELDDVPERGINIITVDTLDRVDIGGQRTPIYVDNPKSDVVVKEDTFYRISVNEGNFYDALLMSFYREYILGSTHYRRVLSVALADKYPTQDVLLLAAELFINIIVIDITEMNNSMLIYDAKITALTPKQKDRPSVVLGRISYQGEDYYEVIATMSDKFYQTVFKRSNDIVQRSIDLDSEGVSDIERYKLPKANKKYRVVTGSGTPILNIVTSAYEKILLDVEHVSDPMSIIYSLLNTEDVLDLTREDPEDSYDAVVWYSEEEDEIAFREAVSLGLSHLNSSGTLVFQLFNLNNNTTQMALYIFTDIFDSVEIVRIDNYLFIVAHTIVDEDPIELLQSVLPNDLAISGIDKDTRFLSHARSVLTHIIRTTMSS